MQRNSSQAFARLMLGRQRLGLAALDECGVPTRKVATRCRGTVLYRDPWQIVAKPEEATRPRGTEGSAVAERLRRSWHECCIPEIKGTVLSRNPWQIVAKSEEPPSRY